MELLLKLFKVSGQEGGEDGSLCIVHQANSIRSITIQ